MAQIIQNFSDQVRPVPPLTTRALTGRRGRDLALSSASFAELFAVAGQFGALHGAAPRRSFSAAGSEAVSASRQRRAAPLRGAARGPPARDLRVRECALSLNALAGHTTQGGLASRPPVAASSSTPTSTQASVSERLHRGVAVYGDRPSALSSRAALLELLHTKDLYAHAPAKVAPYDEDKLKFLRADFVPKPILDFAPDPVREPRRHHSPVRQGRGRLQRALADSTLLGHPPRQVRTVRIRFIRLL